MNATVAFISLMTLIAGAPADQAPTELDPPEIRIGEALFLETRFAE